MNKKAQKELNNKQRTTWEGTFGRSCPSVYVAKNKKAYNRKQKHKCSYFE